MNTKQKIKKVSGIGYDLSTKIHSLTDRELDLFIELAHLNISEDFSREEKISILHKQKQNLLRKALAAFEGKNER